MSFGALHPLQLELRCGAGPLLPQIQAALAQQGEPLRWAITAAQPQSDGSRLLQIEAVVLLPPS